MITKSNNFLRILADLLQNMKKSFCFFRKNIICGNYDNISSRCSVDGFYLIGNFLSTTNLTGLDEDLYF